MADRDKFYIYCQRGEGNRMVLGINTGLDTCSPVTLFYWEAGSQEEAELRARQIEATIRECFQDIRREWYSAGFADGRKRKTPRYPDWDLAAYPYGIRGKPCA